MFSRKKFIKFVVLVFLLVNISALIAAGRGGGKIQGFGSFGLDFFGPVQEALSSGIGYLEKIWQSYFNLVYVSDENLKLKSDLKEFYSKETAYKEVFFENERLRSLLKFSKKIKPEYIAAEVVGRDTAKWFNTIIINRGKDSGVFVNSPVIVPEGVVGQVIKVSKNYSKVLLITDRMSGVDCLIQSSRGRGVVSGTGNDLCIFKYILRKFDVNSGDHVITSGMDKIFPKGLRVGKVVNVKRKDSGIFQDVDIMPFVDFEKLEEVLIIITPPNEKKDD
ncbi:MAG: rod shape-determining protein MreC [Desulforegulaceae bacterium]|nr:rod shape-determining protein MreC [Desulforegulaceae bacterium]